MFKLLRERRQREILKLCDTELERTKRANATFVNSPRDLTERAFLLERARREELTDHPTIKQLDFLQRLLSGLADQIDDRDVPSFIAEGRALGLSETDGVRRLIKHQQVLSLAEHGPEVIERTGDGRKVFLRCESEHKRQPGRLEVRDDGLSFIGEVAIDIPWSTVVHVAKTTDKDANAIAIQEGKRRTATKFTFLESR